MNADNPEVLRSGGSGGVAGISTFMSRTGVAACGRIRTLLSLSNRELATAGNLLTEFLRAISRGGHRGRIACTTIAHRRYLAYVLVCRGGGGRTQPELQFPATVAGRELDRAQGHSVGRPLFGYPETAGGIRTS